jgi:hypothetical protein
MQRNCKKAFGSKNVSIFLSIISFLFLNLFLLILLDTLGFPPFTDELQISWDGEYKEGGTTLYGLYSLFLSAWIAVRIYEKIRNGGFFKINEEYKFDAFDKTYKEDKLKIESLVWLYGITLFMLLTSVSNHIFDYLIFDLMNFNTIPAIIPLLTQIGVGYLIYILLQPYRDKKLSQITQK